MKTEAIVMALAVSLSVQSPLNQGALSGQPPVVIRGRIALYAWWPHELTASDDFVVQTVQGTAEAQFFRLVYSPLNVEESGKPSYMLDRAAFFGAGTIWTFTFHAPQTAVEKTACKDPYPDTIVEGKPGAAKIPAYVRSPGAGDVNVPAVKALPCYVLPVGGMKASNNDEKGQAAK